jgi:hypothetical protein
MFEQYCKVVSDEWDGNDDGVEWQVHYVLMATTDDEGTPCYDLCKDDGAGNGDIICRGYNVHAMRSLTLRLGKFLEWAPGVPAAA